MKKRHEFSQLLNAFYAAMIFCSLILFSNVVYAAPKTNIEWLKQMSLAADQLDYTGEFVVVKGGKIASMQITHAYTEAGTQQKLMSLNGSMREIILGNDVVACVLPDIGMGVREKRQSKQLFNLSISSEKDELERYYTLDKIGSTRVANRDCEQLIVEPKDEYRYGYKLCIDSEYYLLLSAELSTSKGDVLESYMFVDVSFEKVTPIDLNSATQAETLDWMDDKSSAKQEASKTGDKQKWQVVSNNTGFELVQYIERISPVLQTEITHMVLGDGLAKVSVFVSPSYENSGKKALPLKMGSLNSYSKELGAHRITVIGEVPEQTVNLIAENTQIFQ